MEGATGPRLHPLLTMAAISIAVFAAVGIGTLAGFLPGSPAGATEMKHAAAKAPARPGTGMPKDAAPPAPASPHR